MRFPHKSSFKKSVDGNFCYPGTYKVETSLVRYDEIICNRSNQQGVFTVVKFNTSRTDSCKPTTDTEY